MTVIGAGVRYAYSFKSLTEDFPDWAFQEQASGVITAEPVEGGPEVRAGSPQAMRRLLHGLTEPRAAGGSGG